MDAPAIVYVVQHADAILCGGDLTEVDATSDAVLSAYSLGKLRCNRPRALRKLTAGVKDKAN